MILQGGFADFQAVKRYLLVCKCTYMSICIMSACALCVSTCVYVSVCASVYVYLCYVCVWVHVCLHTSVCKCVCVHICVLSGVRVSVCLYFTTNRGLRALRSMRTFSVPQVLTIQLERGSKHLGNQRDSQVSSVRPWMRRPAGVQKAANSERLEGAVPRGLGRAARARAWEVRT